MPHSIQVCVRRFRRCSSNVITAKGLAATTAADGGGAKYVWLGATDQLNEGTWIWENGSQMTFDNWGSGAYGSEPDNFNNQDGLALDRKLAYGIS